MTIPYDQIVQSYPSCRAGRIGSHNLVIGDCGRGIPDYGVPPFHALTIVPSIEVLLAVRHRVRAALPVRDQNETLCVELEDKNRFGEPASGNDPVSFNSTRRALFF